MTYADAAKDLSETSFAYVSHSNKKKNARAKSGDYNSNSESPSSQEYGQVDGASLTGDPVDELHNDFDLRTRTNETKTPAKTPRVPDRPGETIVFDDSEPRLKTNDRRSSIFNEQAERAKMQFDRNFSPSRERSTRSDVFQTPGNTRNPDPQEFGREITSITIDNQILNIRAADAKMQVDTRLWQKEHRSELTHEAKQSFATHVAGYALYKSNKLSAPSTSTDADVSLTKLHNLHNQLRALREHMRLYDVFDVFMIVVPQDVANGADLVRHANGQYALDLFHNYARITTPMVANSNAWYTHWISDTFVHENLMYSLKALKSNTEPSLWNKCLEIYDEYPRHCQGGPLMLSILLTRIQNVSESAIANHLEKVSRLKISKLEGENVDEAISLIKTAHSILISASTPDQNFVPDDFPKTVLKVLQTSSVSDFNMIFKEEQREAERAADKRGGRPVWPTISELTNLASNTYRRFETEGRWNASRRIKQSGFSAATPHAPPRPLRHLKCFNCGSEEHMATACPHPRDERKIAQNRKTYLDNKDKTRSHSSQQRSSSGGQSNRNRHPKPKQRTYLADGTPMIRNKHGGYVPDTKALKAMRESTSSSSGDTAPSDSQSTNPPPILRSGSSKHACFADNTADHTGSSFQNKLAAGFDQPKSTRG